MRRFSWIITIPITVVAVFFAIANREPATVSFWPSPLIVALPTYVLVLGCLFLGFVLGTLVAWFSGSARRRRYRSLADRVEVQASQLAQMRSELAQPVAAPGVAGLPVLSTAPVGTRA